MYTDILYSCSCAARERPTFDYDRYEFNRRQVRERGARCRPRVFVRFLWNVAADAYSACAHAVLPQNMQTLNGFLRSKGRLN